MTVRTVGRGAAVLVRGVGEVLVAPVAVGRGVGELDARRSGLGDLVAAGARLVGAAELSGDGSSGTGAAGACPAGSSWATWLVPGAALSTTNAVVLAASPVIATSARRI
ncbi:hypothetical protein [Micromonospora zingiberis]|uniref:hypothetical protein n=1 Tax=Micromonospora zingiberis TaxID=2053011 RepID=UPI001F0E13B7|nr:hypothetical protein [Micromonospora zingiberis]